MDAGLKYAFTQNKDGSKAFCKFNTILDHFSGNSLLLGGLLSKRVEIDSNIRPRFRRPAILLSSACGSSSQWKTANGCGSAWQRQ